MALYVVDDGNDLVGEGLLVGKGGFHRRIVGMDVLLFRHLSMPIEYG